MKIRAIQIKPHAVETNDEKISEARNFFAAHHSVLLSEVIEFVLLSRLLKMLEDAPLKERVHGKAQGKIIGKETGVDNSAMIVQALKLLFNKPEIFRVVERITGCPKIEKFLGRIYMMRPDSEHFDYWHSDVDGNRLIGLSLNLTLAAYSGGHFIIRENQSEKILNDIFNNTAGDAHLFRISPELRHRVTSVTGETTKIAFAGWFCAAKTS